MKRISVNIYLSYVSLFKDLIVWGQVDPYEAERDLFRIQSLVETRGERSVFIDFPACAKSLDKALSRGRMDCTDFHILGKTRDGLPSFMHSTWKRVFSSSGTLWPEPDIGAVQALRQVLLLYKKVQIPCSEERIHHEVLAFFSLDRTLRPFSVGWISCDHFDQNVSIHDADMGTSVSPTFWGANEYPRGLLKLSQRVCDQIVRRFQHFSPDAIIGNHGPGAVADGRAGLDKYVFPTWPQRLERVFPADLHSAANIRTFEYGLEQSEPVEGNLRTLPAKLIPVNKTQEKPRLIASEPTANQFVQGGLRRYLREQIDAGILSNSLNILRQDLSRALAVRASTDDSLATVDLSNASDRLSCWTVERVFRKAQGLLEALAATRSLLICDPKYTKQTAVMRKYAPQGNATVFPLQSIVYACFAIASTIWSTPKLRVRSDADLWASVKEASYQVRVYGDDIILPTHALPALSSLLEHCQLKVNGAKSHYSGFFAESCGMDAFMGTDVTPVYMASIEDEVKPGDVQSAIDISNECYRAGLLNLGNLVMSRVPEKIVDLLGITRNSGPSTTLFTYSSGTSAKRWRINKFLQREEYMTLVSKPKTERKARSSWVSLFQYFVEAPAGERYGEQFIPPKWTSGWNARSRTRLKREWVPAQR